MAVSGSETGCEQQHHTRIIHRSTSSGRSGLDNPSRGGQAVFERGPAIRIWPNGWWRNAKPRIVCQPGVARFRILAERESAVLCHSTL